MKKLPLVLVALLIGAVSFSQKIKVHVKNIDVHVTTDDTLRYSYNKDVNTIYIFDANNQTVSIDFPTKTDVKDKKVSVTSLDNTYIVKYLDSDAWNLTTIYVTFEIDLKNNTVLLKDHYKYHRTKSGRVYLTETVTEFKDFTISK
jgi:hypothetical protein